MTLKERTYTKLCQEKSQLFCGAIGKMLEQKNDLILDGAISADDAEFLEGMKNCLYWAAPTLLTWKDDATLITIDDFERLAHLVGDNRLREEFDRINENNSWGLGVHHQTEDEMPSVK